jgi:hypothetical protein
MTLGPTETLTKDNVKVRWGEGYTSDSLNKKFLGIPRGIYLGFIPSASGLVLSLSPDIAITLAMSSNTAFEVNDTITGSVSGTNAIVLAVSIGFILISPPTGGTGVFNAGETINASPSGASGSVGEFVSEDISFARVVSDTPLVPGRSEDMIDLVTGDTVTLDFTGFNDGTYYVYTTGSYSVGAVTVGAVSTRTAPPPNTVQEILICVVTKVGGALSIQATAPVTRQEPFATSGSRIGFMPGGSIDQLVAANVTTQEVVASRQDTTGAVAPGFDSGTPQTTGLPSRLAADLSRAGLANRLGKRVVTVQGNDYDPTISTAISNMAQTGTASPVYNISGSFAARVRSEQPFQDLTNGTLPGQTLTFPTVTGTFVVGEMVVGGSGSTASVQSVTSLTITIYNIVGFGFNNGEVVRGQTSGAIATVASSTGGVRVPVVSDPNASYVVTLTLTGTIGSFSVGDVITGSLSGAQGIVRDTSGSTLDVEELYGTFRIVFPPATPVEVVTGPSGHGTVTLISQNTGAITAPASGSGGDPDRNIATITETFAGRKPIDLNGNPIYGRLLFGPNGAAGSPGSGGGPGELLVGTGGTQEINFVQGSVTVTVTNNNLDFTEYFISGDIIEGADGRFYEVSPVFGSVTTDSITLTTGKPYLGPNASAGGGAPFGSPGARRRRRYLIEPVVLSGGAEASASITAGTNIPTSALLRIFFPAWLTEEQSSFDANFAKQAPGDGVILATAPVPGVGYNANTAALPPAAPAPVIGAIRQIQNGGSPVSPGNFHTINFSAGATPGGPGIIDVSASAGPTGPTGPTGPAGPGFTTYGFGLTSSIPISTTSGSQSITPSPFIASIKMASAGIAIDSGDLESPLLLTWISNITITGGGSQVTVDWNNNWTSGPASFIIWVTAAG